MGVRPPLRALHFTQAHTKFSHEFSPPWTRGLTWSSVSSLVEKCRPQKLAGSLSYVQRLSLCRCVWTLGGHRYHDVDRTGDFPMVCDSDHTAVRTKPKRDSTHVKCCHCRLPQVIRLCGGTVHTQAIRFRSRCNENPRWSPYRELEADFWG